RGPAVHPRRPEGGQQPGPRRVPRRGVRRRGVTRRDPVETRVPAEIAPSPPQSRGRGGRMGSPPGRTPRARTGWTKCTVAPAGDLRYCLAQANAAAGADTIDFQAGLTGTIVLTGGPLPVANPVTVTGPGAAALTVRGSGSRVFDVTGSGAFAATIGGLTVANG